MGIQTTIYREDMVARLDQILSRIKIKRGDQQFNVVIGVTPGMEYPYLQVRHWRADTNTGEMDWGHGGKYYPSPHATDSEIIQAIFGLYKGYEEHEVRESFLVDGKRPFGPHISTDALISVADQTEFRAPRA